MRILKICTIATMLLVNTTISSVDFASAAPLGSASSKALLRQADDGSPVIQVRSRRAGAAIAAGVAGAIIGGIIMSQDHIMGGHIPTTRIFTAPLMAPILMAIPFTGLIPVTTEPSLIAHAVFVRMTLAA